jgi:hypothetical protein
MSSERCCDPNILIVRWKILVQYLRGLTLLGSLPNVPLVPLTRIVVEEISSRTIRIFGSQQRSEDIQKINYIKKISSAIKKEKWRALDERLNKAIASGMSLKKLRSIIKKIQTFKIKSEDRTYSTSCTTHTHSCRRDIFYR